MADPIVLNATTRLRPTHLRQRSQSPSRSPIRKAQFTARELDPLLSNLSPDSTLQALQATRTISGGATQDALARSIADTSPAEREIGIRAAFAAQKLREWRSEISWWSWPSRDGRQAGKGFLPPTDQGELSRDVTYLGYLPLGIVNQYQERTEDIRDGIEALEMEDIKDHVLDAHNKPPSRLASMAQSPGARTSYGRLRDFTALITATVIQALPDLAHLNQSLDVWDIRLRVLKSLPDLQQAFNVTGSGLRTAFRTIHDPVQRPLISVRDFDAARNMLQTSVSDLGQKVDKLLELLQGSEDVLPQVWIDTLENIESDYATWVVQAEHIALKNQMSPPSTPQATTVAEEYHNGSSRDSQPPATTKDSTPSQTSTRTPQTRMFHTDTDSKTTLPPLHDPGDVSVRATARSATADSPTSPAVHRKPDLNVIIPKEPRHQRDHSKVSIADSTFSNMSEGEIIGAESTTVTTNPRISLINNPIRLSRDETALSRSHTAKRPELFHRPLSLQQGSTATIEALPKEQSKRVSFRRSISHEFIPYLAPSSDVTASSTSLPLEEDTLDISPVQSDTGFDSVADAGSDEELPPPSPIAPLNIQRTRSQMTESETPISPMLPRRSSKRASLSTNAPFSPISPVGSAPNSPFEVLEGRDKQVRSAGEGSSAVRPRKNLVTSETLEDKIQDILTTLPTKIRLAKEGEDMTKQIMPRTPTRSETPVAHLTLSPVKPERTTRIGGNNTDVRVFHLSQTNSNRDTPPVKLFVRAVGENGERVMVRVGGGWADLGEYLREYSAHHGNRSLEEGRLEVANFPRGNGRDQSSGISSSARHRPRPSVSSQTAHGSVRPTELLRSTSVDLPMMTSELSSHVPLLSGGVHSYTITSPTHTVTTGADGVIHSLVDRMTPPNTANGPAMDRPNPSTPTPPGHNRVQTPASIISNSTATPPSLNIPKYTPLGAAGPKLGGRRALTYGAPLNQESDALVDGIVVKARAASGGFGNSVTTHVVHGPTFTTTTTTTFSTGTPYSPRLSQQYTRDTPDVQSNAPDSPVIEPMPLPSPVIQPPGLAAPQPKRRVSGIRRVFLKRKSDGPRP